MKIILTAFLGVFMILSPAFGWSGGTHEEGTTKAIQILQMMFPDAYNTLFTDAYTRLECTTPYDRFGPVIYDYSEPSPPISYPERLAWEARATDHYKDLEFINVEGGIGEGGRDSPHIDNPTTDPTSFLDFDDNAGVIEVDARVQGWGGYTFSSEGGRYTLRFEVRNGPEPCQLILHLGSLKCNSEQPWYRETGNSDEVYLLVNGHKVWSKEDVDEGNLFNINRDIIFYDRASIQLYEEDNGPSPIAIDDVPHHLEKDNDFISGAVTGSFDLGDRNFTAFNHFIDIPKGRGYYNDYDGYSFERGSGRNARDEEAEFEGFGVGPIDEVVNWWYNDEYIHIPQYYSEHYDPQKCSPAVERYSRGSLTEEFPLADSLGEEGKGVPYSVFLPVDNLAKYWFEVFRNPPDGGKPNIASLGPVVHAIQDASVPHHASSCLGNFHRDYEEGLKGSMGTWLRDSRFIDEVEGLVRSWDRQASNPPRTNTYYDRSYFLNHNPAINWPVDQLVTWMAVQAWHAMSTPGRYNEGTAKELTKKALALSVLVLKIAAEAVEEMSGIHVDITYHSYDAATGQVTFSIVNHRDSAVLESVRMHIVNRDTGETYYGPFFSNSPFMGPSPSTTQVSSCLPGSTMYMCYFLPGKPMGVPCRATITLYTADNMGGSSILKTVDFELPLIFIPQLLIPRPFIPRPP